MDICLTTMPGVTPEQVRELTIKDFFAVLRASEIEKYHMTIHTSLVNSPHVKDPKMPEPPANTYLYGPIGKEKNELLISLDELKATNDDLDDLLEVRKEIIDGDRPIRNNGARATKAEELGLDLKRG